MLDLKYFIRQSNISTHQLLKGFLQTGVLSKANITILSLRRGILAQHPHIPHQLSLQLHTTSDKDEWCQSIF